MSFFEAPKRVICTSVLDKRTLSSARGDLFSCSVSPTLRFSQGTWMGTQFAFKNLGTYILLVGYKICLEIQTSPRCKQFDTAIWSHSSLMYIRKVFLPNYCSIQWNPVQCRQFLNFLNVGYEFPNFFELTNLET